MSEILDTVAAFFQEDEWPFSLMEELTALRTGFKGSNGEWTCYARARDEQEQFIFYSICPVKAPEDERQRMAEFLTRANYGLLIGNFEMDFSDGEIRYKSSIDVEDDRLSPALVKNIVYANVLTMDRYMPGIMKVLYADMAPAEAIELIEG
ncbi:MAG TPA: YbjN domain-containing protein [Chloroflexi bacterium]|nr:YbjN domain-containing protein [Chloroflexota bacterium]